MKQCIAIPFHRHVEMGRQIHDTIEKLWAFRREINESKQSPYSRDAVNDLNASINQLDRLRSKLENVLCTTGCMDDESITCNPCNVYYGPFPGKGQ